MVKLRNVGISASEVIELNDLVLGFISSKNIVPDILVAAKTMSENDGLVTWA